MRNRAVVLSLLGFAFAAGVPARADAGAWVLQKGEYYTVISGSHTGSTEFFDREGTRQTNFARLLFEQRDLRSTTEFGWKRLANLLISIPVRSVTQRLDAADATASSTGLADMTLGARWKLVDGATAVSLETDWLAPLGYQHGGFMNGPPLGAGRQQVSGTLQLGTPLKVAEGFLEFSAGYAYDFETVSDGDRSAGGSAGVAVWAAVPVLVSGHYAYAQSLGVSDPFLKQSSHRAGGQVLYRIDEHFDIFAGSEYTFSGKNVARTDAYYVGFAVKKTQLNRLQGFLGGTRHP